MLEPAFQFCDIVLYIGNRLICMRLVSKILLELWFLVNYLSWVFVLMFFFMFDLKRWSWRIRLRILVLNW